jgi:hypothetical protein
MIKICGDAVKSRSLGLLSLFTLVGTIILMVILVPEILRRQAAPTM